MVRYRTRGEYLPIRSKAASLLPTVLKHTTPPLLKQPFRPELLRTYATRLATPAAGPREGHDWDPVPAWLRRLALSLLFFAQVRDHGIRIFVGQ